MSGVLPEPPNESPLSRRGFLAAGAAGAAGLALPRRLRHLVETAAATCPAPGGLAAIEHVVIVMQENRSFDHYFGSYRGVLGFDDPGGVFAQPGYPAGRNPDGHLLPFRFDTQAGNGECTADVVHDWAPQHRCWAGGAMDGWVRTHLVEDGAVGTNVMGFHNRADLSFYYALADAFTICDRYFCSAMGPTDPNRLYAMTGTLDPDGRAGGPVVQSAGTPTSAPTLSWTTMPERLRANGISWKIYASSDSTYFDGDNTMLFFKQYQADADLAAKALAPTFPGHFLADIAAGELPQVSWVITPTAQLEHPPSPSVFGEVAISQLLDGLTGDAALWAKTVVFLTWDENGGLFDHLRPPTPPPGTRGERLTTATLPPEAQGIREPIGLGFRVPTLVLSPFARGGFVCSDVFDHTSLLRFLETRFGVEVPNLSAWRRGAVGDLTSTLDFSTPDLSVPALPAVSLADPRVVRECVPDAVTSSFINGAPYPVPANARPRQEPGTARRRSGCATGGTGGQPPPASGGDAGDGSLAATGGGSGAGEVLLGLAALGAAAVQRRVPPQP